MSEPIRIASHRGPYQVEFEAGDPFSSYPSAQDGPKTHVVLDRQVGLLYRDALRSLLDGRSVLEIEATEPAKSLERCSAYVEALVAGGLRRGHVLLAIGGGVVQDITCFLSAVLLRGLDWEFYPTTLLAQADSCIGSKSSINVGTIKNIVGTFTPPWNLTGMPALSIPCGFSAAGLPLGLQLAGRPLEDGVVLRLAHAYQQATDWHLRRPPVCA